MPRIMPTGESAGAGFSLVMPIMLQEFLPERQPKEMLGTGVNICFQCEDALALYREFKSRGIRIRKHPFVGNRLWVVPVTDPHGYRIEFSSPTDAPEESELEEQGCLTATGLNEEDGRFLTDLAAQSSRH
jgi:hypothetical protein